MQPNRLELSCPAEAGRSQPILALDGGPGAPPNASARRVSFSELLGGNDFLDWRDSSSSIGELHLFGGAIDRRIAARKSGAEGRGLHGLGE